ncbi:chloride channel protein, partial [Oleiagrimonas sp. MCCC 1A03011]|uniref:chloride channel protein n=1 Tax=Oleiagrimonas sp. MCCC 1A03011 TaxID=1926883 RepID=UPI00272D34F1
PRRTRMLNARVLRIVLLAIVLGVAASVIAKVLVALIGLITNLAFYGRWSTTFVNPTTLHLGAWVIAVPIVGGLIVGVMARWGSTAIRGHGIPEAMEQILLNESRVPPRVTWLKPVSSAIAIGTGGPFGAEGPIIATGGALGSLLGQLLHVTADERKTLLAAGAAAGMATIFSAPVSAVLLAVELLLFERRARSLIPVMPLTPNGKLDRKALPAPEDDAYVRHVYEPPQGETEQTLASIWEELLGVDKVGRNDNFFELGGHSLMAVKLMERMRRLGYGIEVRALFATPTLADLAATLGECQDVAVPPNLITPDAVAITPDMLPLVDLSQADIDRIVTRVPGGAANIQDIYALSPLQDGILFHHLLAADGDPYLLAGQMAFADKARLDSFLVAV